MTFAETVRGLMAQDLRGSPRLRNYLEYRCAEIAAVIETADRCPHQSGELAEALRKLEGKS